MMMLTLDEVMFWKLERRWEVVDDRMQLGMPKARGGTRRDKTRALGVVK
jgi:hypothetical protein